MRTKIEMNMSAWKQLPPASISANPSRESYYEDHRAKTSKNYGETISESSGNFKVVIRIRPPLERETVPYVQFQSSVISM